MKRPLKVEARRIGRLDDVDFLALGVPDVADKNPAARGVVRHAMRAAQAEAVEFSRTFSLPTKGLSLGINSWRCGRLPAVCGSDG